MRCKIVTALCVGLLFAAAFYSENSYAQNRTLKESCKAYLLSTALVLGIGSSVNANDSIRVPISQAWRQRIETSSHQENGYEAFTKLINPFIFRNLPENKAFLKDLVSASSETAQEGIYTDTYTKVLFELKKIWERMTLEEQVLLEKPADGFLEDLKNDPQKVRTPFEHYRFLFTESGFKIFTLLAEKHIENGELILAVRALEEALVFNNHNFKILPEFEQELFIEKLSRLYLMLGWEDRPFIVAPLARLEPQRFYQGVLLQELDQFLIRLEAFQNKIFRIFSSPSKQELVNSPTQPLVENSKSAGFSKLYLSKEEVQFVVYASDLDSFNLIDEELVVFEPSFQWGSTIIAFVRASRSPQFGWIQFDKRTGEILNSQTANPVPALWNYLRGIDLKTGISKEAYGDIYTLASKNGRMGLHWNLGWHSSSIASFAIDPAGLWTGMGIGADIPNLEQNSRNIYLDSIPEIENRSSQEKMHFEPIIFKAIEKQLNAQIPENKILQTLVKSLDQDHPLRAPALKALEQIIDSEELEPKFFKLIGVEEYLDNNERETLIDIIGDFPSQQKLQGNPFQHKPSADENPF